MLSKIVLDIYARFLELTLWLSLIAFVAVGWNLPGRLHGVAGAGVGCIAWALFAVVFFGTFLLLNDMRRILRNIESLTGKGSSPS